jgi:hypothetical protein
MLAKATSSTTCNTPTQQPLMFSAAYFLTLNAHRPVLANPVTHHQLRKSSADMPAAIIKPAAGLTQTKKQKHN